MAKWKSEENNIVTNIQWVKSYKWSIIQGMIEIKFLIKKFTIYPVPHSRMMLRTMKSRDEKE